MKRESLVIAIGAPVITTFVLLKIFPEIYSQFTSQSLLSGVAVMAAINITTSKGSEVVPVPQKHIFVDTLDRLMAQRGWWKKMTQGEALLYRAPLLISLFVADLDVEFPTPDTATLSGPQWLVRRLSLTLSKT